MSQRQKSKASRLRREREKVARFIASVKCQPDEIYTRGSMALFHLLNGTTSNLLKGNGFGFDVHEARAAATALVALEVEQTISEDWCRARGLGPENSDDHQLPYAWKLVQGPAALGPTAYAAECERLGDRGWDIAVPSIFDTLVPACRDNSRGGWPGNLAREWPGDSRAPMGRTLAKLGRAVLRALDGQESGCQGPECEDGQERAGSDGFVTNWRKCRDCKGTGHNLRGSLPSIDDWAPVAVAAASDAVIGAAEPNEHQREPVVDQHSRTVMDGCQRPSRPGSSLPLFTTVLTDGTTLERSETRVVARGEHRERRSNFSGWVVDDWSEDSTLDERITARSFSGVYHDQSKWPGWRRGELKHAQQRRNRQLRAEPLWDNQALETLIGAPVEYRTAVNTMLQGNSVDLMVIDDLVQFSEND